MIGMYNNYRKPKPTKWERFVGFITPRWWDGLWWRYHSSGRLGGRYTGGRTFKIENLALVFSGTALIIVIILLILHG